MYVCEIFLKAFGVLEEFYGCMEFRISRYGDVPTHPSQVRKFRLFSLGNFLELFLRIYWDKLCESCLYGRAHVPSFSASSVGCLGFPCFCFDNKKCFAPVSCACLNWFMIYR